MKYSELFHTVQGEGRFVGIPSVFFRTSYCNLRCHWCDTPYTSWKPENKDISVEKAIKEIQKFNCMHVVITGGEPFVQDNDLQDLVGYLATDGHVITIETNATIWKAVDGVSLVSMSPKLSNSTPSIEQDKKWNIKHERERINKGVIKQFLRNYPCQVKFVVSQPDDLAEIDALQKELHIPKAGLYLMPEGITREQIREKQEWLVDICKEKQYNYSPRLHVDIWGTKRGV